MTATYLATGRLGEPQRPLVLERVLDVEVVLVVEDRDGRAITVLGVCAILLASRRDGDSREIDLLVEAFCRGGGHD